MSRLKHLNLGILLCCSMDSVNVYAANPVVCLEATLGEVCIELFEQQAPLSVANFLSYVESGDYNGTIIHRVIPGFIVQGGGFRITEEVGNDLLQLTPVESKGEIQNEFGFSNIRGTVAMAKFADNPDSATSEWFVNLQDNSENLDNQNGGFTVFGQVIDDGMQVVEAIAELERFDFGGALTDTPTINFNGSTAKVENFVFVNTANYINPPIPVGVFQNNRLTTPVDAGTFGKLTVAMDLLTLKPEITFQLDLSSVTPLEETSMELATYNEQDSTLNIPSVDVQGTLRVTNVVMKLTDLDAWIFTVVSLDGL